MSNHNGYAVYIKKDGDTFVRNHVELFLIRRGIDHADYVQEWFPDAGITPTWYREVAGSPRNPDAPPAQPINFPEDALPALAEAVNAHIGIYAGADYARLRSDYDRLARELEEANRFIRETLETLLTKRSAFKKENNE